MTADRSDHHPDNITYVDADPLIPGHLPAGHVHHRGSDRCLRNDGGAACPSPAESRARVRELEAEVKRLRLAKGPALFEEMLTAILDRAESAEAERDALQQLLANVQRDLLEAETKLAQSVPAYYGWATYDDGSRSDLEWWVKTGDDDWVSLNSERRTTSDIMLEHFSCWPVDGPPHAAGVRP